MSKKGRQNHEKDPVYVYETGTNEWEKVESESPARRWQHTATKIGQTKILFLGGISNCFGPKRTFAARGLQKTSQELMFIKVFWPGCPRTDSGRKSRSWAPKML